MREAEIKIALVRWLLDQLQPDEIIASELQFSYALNRADLVVSSPTRLSSYEIKSSYDDFRRFGRQQEAYRSAFLDSHLVVPSTLLSTAREHLSRSTGIVTITETGEVNIHRKALPKLGLSRRDALAWLRHSDKKRIELEEGLRGITLTEKELTSRALQTVYDRLKPRFDTFRKERGKSFNSDDLGMLSLPTRIR